MTFKAFAHLAVVAMTAGALVGCATAEQAAVGSSAPPEADRRAILSMAGEYDVTFRFTETVAIAEGYALKEPDVSGADEVISVIVDEPGFISLQHLLVVDIGEGMDPIVVKHWRQDWIWEPAEVLAFEGRGTWRRDSIPAAEREGAWSQTVYQVDDSPRYAGYGRWEHRGEISTWASNRIWRPLPRRDDTTRSDYQVIECVNRHTITPWGWSHEEDNAKVALTEAGPREIVREIGTNSYESTDAIEEAAAERYWTATAGLWSTVREAWSALETDGRGFSIADDAEGNLLYTPMLILADRLLAGGIDEATAESEALDLIRRQTSGPAAAALAAAEQRSPVTTPAP
jgi:hypothetical protein